MTTETKYRRVKILPPSAACPRCGAAGKRHSIGKRHVREVGVTGPVVVEVEYAKFLCGRCKRHFTAPMDHIAGAGRRYSRRVERLAVDLVLIDNMTLDRASIRLRQLYHVRAPTTTIHDWVSERMS